jgi:hypothetical protein
MQEEVAQGDHYKRSSSEDENENQIFEVSET